MHYRKLIALVRRSAAAVVGALVGALALTATAHDIPTDVKINAFVKPEGHRLEFLIRVPLAAMIEVDFPTRGAGYLELARADEALHHAAKLYLIDNITLYENDVALPPPRIVDARVSLASDRSFASYDAARAHVAGPPLANIRGDAMSRYRSRKPLKGSRHHGLRCKTCTCVGNLPFAYRLPAQRSLAELVSELSGGRLDV